MANPPRAVRERTFRGISAVQSLSGTADSRGVFCPRVLSSNRFPEAFRMTPATHASKGFSMVELMIVITIVGMLIGFGVPGYRRYSQTQSLRGSAENLVQTVHLQRSKAMSTGQDVVLNFNTSAPYGWTSVSQGRSYSYVLPNGIQYTSATPASLTLGRNGRVSTSGTVVLVNNLGITDTVSIQISGMAMVR